MDAPLYPPATAFAQPMRQPRVLNTRDIAIADLQQIPAAWAIVLKEMPRIEAMIGNEQLKPHLGNFSFSDLIQFGIAKADALARIDAQLLTLGAQ